MADSGNLCRRTEERSSSRRRILILVVAVAVILSCQIQPLADNAAVLRFSGLEQTESFSRIVVFLETPAKSDDLSIPLIPTVEFVEIAAEQATVGPVQVGSPSDSTGEISITELAPGEEYHAFAFLFAEADGEEYVAAIANPLESEDAPVMLSSGNNLISLTLRPTPGSVRWTFESGGTFPGTAALGDNDTIYVGSSDNFLYALNREDGSLRWSAETEGSVSGSPAIADDGTVFVGSMDYNLYAFDGETGDEIWAFDAGREVRAGGPSVDTDGNVFFGTFDTNGGNELISLDSQGNERWRVEVGENVNASPAVGLDGSVYVGTYWSDGANLFSFDGETGNQQWSLDTGALISNGPVLDTTDILYAGTRGPGVYALDASDGSEIWLFDNVPDFYVVLSPTIGPDGTLYVGDQADNVYAIDPMDGSEIWHLEVGGSVNSSAVIGDNGVLYFGSDDDNLYAVDAETGSVLWTENAGGRVEAGPVMDENGILYFGSTLIDSVFYAVNTSANGPADTPWPMFGADVRNTGRQR